MSLESGAVKASESEATTLKVINTDTLEFLVMLDHRGDVQACGSSKWTLTAGVVIPCGGLADTLNTRKFTSLKLLTVSKSGGADLTSSGREGRESLLFVDSDGKGGCCRVVVVSLVSMIWGAEP